jgi:hypothetical protein
MSWLARAGILVFILIAGPASSEIKHGRVVLFSAGPPVRIDALFNQETQRYRFPRELDAFLAAQDAATNADLMQEELKKLGLADREKQRVGILDTGILHDHPALRGMVGEAIDLTGEGKGDQNGHGTVVAIIYAHSAFLPVEIVDIKSVPSSGIGEYDLLIRGLEWSRGKKIEVLNLSVGIYLPCVSEKIDKAATNSRRSCDRQEICRKADELRNDGIMITAAVGNEVGRIACPACCKSVIAVGTQHYNTGADVLAGPK